MANFDVDGTTVLYSTLTGIADGDTITLANNGTIDFDSNTVKLGATSAGAYGIICAYRGNVIVRDGVTLNLNGGGRILDTYSSGITCTFTMGDGAGVRKWGTNQCTLDLFNGDPVSFGKFVFNGTEQNPNVIDGNGSLTVGSQYYKDSCEGGVVHFVNVPNTYFANGGVDVDHMVFDSDCGPLHIHGSGDYMLKPSETFRIGNLRHEKAGAINLDIDSLSVPTGTSVRLIEKMRLFGDYYYTAADNMVFRDAYYYKTDGTGSCGRFESSWTNSRQIPASTSDYPFNPTKGRKDCIAFAHKRASETDIGRFQSPHWPGGEAVCDLDGVVFACYEPVGEDGGNPAMGPTDAVPGNIARIRNCLFSPSWLACLALFSYNGLRVLFMNNTAKRDSTIPAEWHYGMIGLGEGTLVYADTLYAYNNLLVGSRIIENYLDPGDYSNAQDDCVVDADYNNITDITDDPYDLDIGARLYQSTPGTNDLNLNPQFKNASGTLLEYAQSLGCEETTWPEAIAWLEGKILDETISPIDAVNWMRDAYTPTVALPGKSGTDAAIDAIFGEVVFSGYIGAVEPETGNLASVGCTLSGFSTLVQGVQVNGGSASIAAPSIAALAQGVQVNGASAQLSVPTIKFSFGDIGGARAAKLMPIIHHHHMRFAS